MNRLSLALYVAWVIGVLIMFAFPPNDPPSAPNGVGLARGFPVSYAHPAPLSAWAGQHSGPVIVVDGGAPPWPDDGLTTADDAPLSYEERFSHEAIGPDWGVGGGRRVGVCPVASAAVLKQGVGE